MHTSVQEFGQPKELYRTRRVMRLALIALRAAGMVVFRTQVRGEAGLIACGAMLPATHCNTVCARLMDFDLHANGPQSRFLCAPA